MSQQGAPLPPEVLFDCITQTCMDIDQKSIPDEMGMIVAQETDLMLFVDDLVDDSWLGASLDEETAQLSLGIPENADSNLIEMQVVQRDIFEEVKVEVKGFRELPHPQLAQAGKGEKKLKSHKNNNWSLRRADKLRSALGWEMTVPFGDFPLAKVDELLANIFSRVVKVKGGEYRAESLLNMMRGYNRLLRRASDLRSLKDPSVIPLGKEFCIKKHLAFTRTRLTLDAAVKKPAVDGTNKQRKKVNHITQVQEAAVLADVNHQIYHNQGCQKRTALYLLCKCGIRGVDELWELQHNDLAVKTDKNGREYLQYMERHSKNNQYTLERTKEEQFCKPYHSYEADFILTAKQYLRHMPPFIEGVKDALFLGAIKNPASIVWYNRAHKVGKGTAAKWLENMLKLVGLPDILFSNKSGRTTLITRLAAQGVPNDVGMLLSGHHTADGYGRYDRTVELKQEAATMVAHTPGMNYGVALAIVSKRFVEEELIGDKTSLKPLIDHVSRGDTSNAIMPYVSKASSSGTTSKPTLQLQAAKMLHNLHNQVPKQLQANSETVTMNDPPKKLAMWNTHYDEIDWDAAMKSDPRKANALGGLPQPAPVVVGTGNAFSNCQNCTIQINLPPSFDPTNFNWRKALELDKENLQPENSN